MSYIFSRVLVEEFLGANCSASAPSAPSNLNPTQQAYCSPARMTAYSRLSRYGMTYAPLTDDRGEALLTWYLEASLARTFQLREKARALTAPAPACGGKCTELSMRYDRNSHSWKTHLCLWEEDLPESSVTLPKSGTMRNGLCWERTMWEPRMSGNASGYLLAQEREIWPTPRAGKSSSENPESWLARYAAGKVSTPPLGLAVKFATPQARDFRTGESNRWDNPHRSRNLNDQIAKYPTPRTKGMCGGDGELSENEILGRPGNYHDGRAETDDCGEWWSAEPDVGRVAHRVAARVDRLKAIGNGQVPAVAATAFRILLERIQEGKEDV